MTDGKFFLWDELAGPVRRTPCSHFKKVLKGFHFSFILWVWLFGSHVYLCTGSSGTEVAANCELP